MITMKHFTAAHHALLVAWISRAIVQATGEKRGEQIVRKAVVKYGKQRGRRMALRAKANGHPLTMANYIAYVEWKPEKGDMTQKILEKSPDLRMNIYKCPWHTTWKENDLMSYGRYFCLEIDQALVEGFNKDLRLDILGTHPNNADFCDLIFRGADLTAFNMAKLIYKKTIHPGKKAHMSWEYHTGHMYKTMGEVIRDELDKQADEILAVALGDFTEKYGEQAGRIITRYKNTDFNQLPQ